MRARSGPAAVAAAPGPAGARAVDWGVGDGVLRVHGSTDQLTRPPAEPDPAALTRAQLAAYLEQVATVTLWPFTGKALSLSRAATYRAAVAGSIHALALGRRRVVPSRWLEATLMLDDADAKGLPAVCDPEPQP